VTSIGVGAFSNCASLTSITVSEYNVAYQSIDDNLYSKDGKTLIQYAIGKTATSFTIPESVTSIGEYAFAYCSSLTSITFKDTSTWYRTTSETDWNNKTGGTETDVTNASINARYFMETYGWYYWYKL